MLSSTMMSGFHSAEALCWRCKLDGLLDLRDSDGRISGSARTGVVGGVENVSTSLGDSTDCMAKELVYLDWSRESQVYDINGERVLREEDVSQTTGRDLKQCLNLSCRRCCEC